MIDRVQDRPRMEYITRPSNTHSKNQFITCCLFNCGRVDLQDAGRSPYWQVTQQQVMSVVWAKPPVLYGSEGKSRAIGTQDALHSVRLHTLVSLRSHSEVERHECASRLQQRTI
jgi:hypothetical protein